MSKFYEKDHSLETIWRAIILLGANNKSYKFALGKSLIQVATSGKTEIKMNALAPMFAQHTLAHVRSGNKQGVSDDRLGPFLSACQKFNAKEIDENQLYAETERNAFNDVIERFHTINRADAPIQFYDTSAFRTEKKIVLHDELLNLINSPHGKSLSNEIEARWNLVENAWTLNLPANLLDVFYDNTTKLFYLTKNEAGKTRRKDVTSAREALNGYQKGHCFFCFDIISVDRNAENVCHVDHFFPHTLFDKSQTNINYNGTWNLVLSCSECNLLKSAKVPEKKYLDRLHARNEFYVTSHLPLKESILKTGNDEQKRISFLQGVFNQSLTVLIQKFETSHKMEPRF